jgi:hypothetical protein
VSGRLPSRSPEAWAGRLPAVHLLLLLGAAAWGAAFQWRLSRSHVPDADYAAVADVLSREGRAGDVVLLYPWWTERARLFVPASLPVVGHLHSDDEPLEEHPRIWLLSVPGLPRADLPAFERTHMQRREKAGADRRFGHLALSLWNNGLHRPARFSAAAALPEAAAWLESPDGRRTACPWNGRSHECPGGFGAATGWHEVDQVPRRCLSLRPPARGARLVLEWPSVPAAPGDTVGLEGGITWEHAAKVGPDHGDVTVTAFSGGRTLATLVAREGSEAFLRTSGSAQPSGAPLSLGIGAAGPRDRESCIGLFVRAGGAP